MTLVWSLDLPDSEKIVLLALADCANDEGHCWPSMRSLTVKCSKSDRTIQYAIKKLVEEGHLTRREVPGKGCNYSVHPRNSCAPEEIAPPKGTTQTPEAASDKPSRTINTGTKVPLVERVQNHWNEVAKRCSYHKAEVLDASRRQTIRLRAKEHGEDRLLEAFDLAGKATWMLAKAKSGEWKADLDFILRPGTLRKLFEGGYGQDDSTASEKWTPERMAAYAAKHGDGAQAVGSVAKKIMEGVQTQ